MSIRKGICCFEDDVFKCDKPSLPFSRHCQRHILYNVDQLLFVRCTAKDNETLAQCCNPSLDVLADEPLCNHHRWIKSSTPSMQEDDALKANVIGSGKGKGKIQAGPGRPGKRSKKRRKLIGGKGIPGGSIDSIDSSSFLSQDSSDSIFVNSENCDTSQVHLYAIKIEPNIDTATSLPIESSQPNQQTCIVPTIPQTMPLQMQQQTHHQHHRPQQHQPMHLNHVVPSSHLPNERSTLDNLSVIPGTTLLLRGEQTSITQPLASTVPVVLPDATRNGIITGHLDGVTTLAPSDEALVASLVAELPTLCAENGPEPEPPGFVDADLTDVLNKIPDDAFNDLFVDNLKNGDIPSKEESEALEQALAAVSKNVQYLSVAAAAVGGSRSAVNNASREGITSVTSTTVINGDSNYYSHAAQHHNHHGTVNGEIPQLSHHQTLPVNTLTTPSSQLTHQPPTQPPPPTLSSSSSTSSAPPSSISSSHDLANRSIASTSLNLNENDILGLANNILTSLTTEQQQHLNGLIDGALASGTLTPPTIKSALASLSSLQQESESCETHL
uniref:KANL2-like probable zinc-finger domain-containing protein n=2 Tax=Tetranychus urticae TaxID=32264 RepID=T1KZ46_TETUR